MEDHKFVRRQGPHIFRIRASVCIKIGARRKERNMNLYVVRNGLEKIITYFKMLSER
jgi:hypothetical protein